MILLGIKLFLRADKLLNLKVEDFVKEYQVIPDGQVIKALTLNVKGKFLDICNTVLHHQSLCCTHNFILTRKIRRESRYAKDIG
jgi:hypothetical protein